MLLKYLLLQRMLQLLLQLRVLLLLLLQLLLELLLMLQQLLLLLDWSVSAARRLLILSALISTREPCYLSQCLTLSNVPFGWKTWENCLPLADGPCAGDCAQPCKSANMFCQTVIFSLCLFMSSSLRDNSAFRSVISSLITSSGFNADSKNLFCRKKASICLARSTNLMVACSISARPSSLSTVKPQDAPVPLFPSPSSFINMLKHCWKLINNDKWHKNTRLNICHFVHGWRTRCSYQW